MLFNFPRIEISPDKISIFLLSAIASFATFNSGSIALANDPDNSPRVWFDLKITVQEATHEMDAYPGVKVILDRLTFFGGNEEPQILVPIAGDDMPPMMRTDGGGMATFSFLLLDVNLEDLSQERVGGQFTLEPSLDNADAFTSISRSFGLPAKDLPVIGARRSIPVLGGEVVQKAPEPLTLLGTAVALGLGVCFKRKMLG